MLNCGSTYAIVRAARSNTTMKAHVSIGFAAAPPARPPVIARGFSNANFEPSGENARLRTLPRIVSRRAGASHTVPGVLRVALHTLRPSSDGQTARRPSGEMTALAGGAVGAAWIAGPGGAACWAKGTLAAASRIVSEKARDRCRMLRRMIADVRRSYFFFTSDAPEHICWTSTARMKWVASIMWRPVTGSTVNVPQSSCFCASTLFVRLVSAVASETGQYAIA